MLTTLAAYVCACAAPTMFARPSGQIVCQRCGLPVVAKTVEAPRP